MIVVSKWVRGYTYTV